MNKFFLCCIFLISLSSYGETRDRWCENRFMKDNMGSSTELTIVDNPLIEVGGNESGKVLKLSNIDQRGSFALNLTRYIGNASDRITDISDYDILQFKYYIVNPPYTNYTARIRMEDAAGNPIAATWSNLSQNWRSASFKIPKASDSETTWIQISVYYVTTGDWNDAFPGMEIYLDDFEFIDTSYTPSSIENEKTAAAQFTVNGKNLYIHNLQAYSSVLIYDSHGRNIYTAEINDNMDYHFTEQGIYFVSVKNEHGIENRKFFIKE